VLPAFLILALLVARRSIAGDEAPAPLRLADVIEEARSANPEIKVARERTKAARSVPTRVAAYDDPVASWEAWNAPESFRVDHADNNIFRLSQRIPFPGKRSLAGRSGERDADIAAADATMTELDIVAMVRRAYYELWKSHHNLAIYSSDKDLVERLAKVAEQKYAVGQVGQPDVLRSQVELTRLINRVTTGRLAIDGWRAELNALLSRKPGEALGVPEDPPQPRLDETDDDFVARAFRSRPEVSAKAAAVERERTKVAMARLDFLPDFEFSVSRFANYQNRDGFGAMASVSLPFAYKWKYDAEVDEARAGLAAAEAERRQVEDRVAREVRQAFLRARAALLQRELLITTHVPLAEQTLGASQIGYQTGKIDFLSLIDSLRAVESVHLEHVDAEAEFQKAFADLERAVGEPMEKGEMR
jgi:cobalt-zinc-cadmium efflux system outer membrane protein